MITMKRKNGTWVGVQPKNKLLIIGPWAKEEHTRIYRLRGRLGSFTHRSAKGKVYAQIYDEKGEEAYISINWREGQQIDMIMAA